MHRVLRFKPNLRVTLAGDELVFLVGEHERFLLKGRLYELVAPLVDGRRTEWQIIETLEGQVAPPDVYFALTNLEKKGYLVEASAAQPAEAAALWYGLGVDAELAAERLAATPVAVIALGAEAREPLVEALAGAGVSVRDDAALRVVVTADYCDSALSPLNRLALEERGRFMLLKPGGATPWIGPMLGSEGGPCWACLAQRIASNRPVEAYVARRTGSPLITPQRASSPASERAALDLSALALARWIADGGRGILDEKLLTLDLARLRIDAHAVVRRPQCPACGDPHLLEKRAEELVSFEPRPKRFTDDGGYRCMTPEETFQRYEHLISPVTGVVTSLGPVSDRDHPLRPVYGAAYFICPAAMRTPGIEDFSRASLGKGHTAAQSRTGALCEAIERYSAIFQGDEPRRRAQLSELGEAAVPPGALLNFSETQYRRRDELNGDIHDYRRKIPLPFDERVSIDWTPVWSLTRGRRRYLPTAYCYLHAPAPPEGEFCYLDPNGHASGNCLEEAILQAFFELAERDAIGVWWYNRIQRPAVDLASFEQPYFRALEAHYKSMGQRLWVLDITNDLGVPAFVALSRAESTGRLCVGFGCHAEARLGVQRALTELNQIFDPTASSPAPLDAAAIEDPAYLFPDDSQGPRRRGDYPSVAHSDLRGDVLACVERAERAGLEMLVLDQTRPDIGLCAVKVIVPGLRHIWPRLGPGRLYEVPVRLGWLDAPRAEADLNPVHLYL